MWRRSSPSCRRRPAATSCQPASSADYAAFAGTLEALFAGEYADRVSSDGIRLERYVLLAVADKPR